MWARALVCHRNRNSLLAYMYASHVRARLQYDGEKIRNRGGQRKVRRVLADGA